MANLTTTFYDQGGCVIGDAQYQDDTLKFVGADTYAAGTILARGADTYLVPCNPANSDGTEIPVAILTIASSRTGAGNNPIRPLIAGKVRKEKILFDGGATVTIAVCDDLKDTGILALKVDETNILDNV